MIIPMYSGLICTDEIRGAVSASSALGSEIDSSIRARIAARARFACASAFSMISRLTPVILMSICSAVMPSAVPATLKSMSPR